MVERRKPVAEAKVVERRNLVAHGAMVVVKGRKLVTEATMGVEGRKPGGGGDDGGGEEKTGGEGDDGGGGE